jgi:GNAT superfamily N-acetyltransferase
MGASTLRLELVMPLSQQALLIAVTNYGQGIGTALMGQIESCFGKVQRFELLTGDKSKRNIHLYERLGYKIFKNQRINKNLSFVFMEKHQSVGYLL